MLARIRLVTLFALIALVLPSQARAQAPSRADAAARYGIGAGPRLEHTATAARPLQQQKDVLDITQRRTRQGMGQPVALMVVGGAAVVLGALIGDDVGTVFMIGGAVALLIGLYQYMQ